MHCPIFVLHPSAHSVRRALAIQMIICKEWGLAGNENPLQGSFVLDQLGDLVLAENLIHTAHAACWYS